ncbi:MAG: hypothetical protein AAF138_02850 [Planctomycetota bacterium]
MSGRACYLQRADRGARLVGARLLSARTEAQWTAAPGEAPETAPNDAADWVVAELTKVPKGKNRELRLICLDPDGGLCSWLSAPTDEPSALAATLAQAGQDEGPRSELDAGAIEHGLVAAGAFGPDMQVAGGASVQALSAPQHVTAREGESRRLSVLATPDVPARLFLDRLDRLGLERPPVITLWHAMALAWGAAPNERRDEEEVAAVVLIEPDGRLAWCWSKGADLLACGRARVADADSAAARLNADWLGWSAQLGLAPDRIACVATDGSADTTDDTSDAVNEDAIAMRDHGTGYEPLAQALDRAWPGASVRFAAVGDPVGATLRQALTDDEMPAVEAGASRVVRTLSARPGRAHKSMYRWVSLAIVAGAVMLAAAGWRLRDVAADARVEAAALKADQRAAIEAYDPALIRARRPIEELRREMESLTQARAVPSGVEAPWPVMPEIETITLVLSNLGVDVELINVSVSQTQAQFEVRVPDTETYEMVQNALRSIADSNVDTWTSRTRADRVDGQRTLVCVFTGTWPTGPQNRPSAIPTAGSSSGSGSGGRS